MMKLLSALAFAGLALTLTWRAVAAPYLGQCDTAEQLVQSWPQLERTILQLRQSRPLTIVTVGSSSTLGTAASSPAGTWPARLQDELAHRFPGSPITVVNKARSRQSAAEMARRFGEDIFAASPHLVVWESGTAEAIRGTDVEDYRTALLAGVDELQARGIDVILMDMQFARGPAALINFDPYLEVEREVAEMRGLAYFPRFAIMREWVQAGLFVLEDLRKADQSKVADAIYSCIGRLIAEGIARSVR